MANDEVSKAGMFCLVWVSLPYERPANAEKCFVIRVDHAESGDKALEIPWPEGLTVAEALKAWALSFIVKETPKGHWSDCPACYDYHERQHVGDEQAHEHVYENDEPAANKDFRYRG